jgi:hypothetical protein
MYEDRSTENSPLSKIRTKYSLAKIWKLSGTLLCLTDMVILYKIDLFW